MGEKGGRLGGINLITADVPGAKPACFRGGHPLLGGYRKGGGGEGNPKGEMYEELYLGWVSMLRKSPGETVPSLSEIPEDKSGQREGTFNGPSASLCQGEWELP